MGDVAQNALVHHFISCVFCGSEIVSVHTVIESQNSLGWKGPLDVSLSNPPPQVTVCYFDCKR